MHERITVIYIISDRRSGSTLLENILSKSFEAVSIGELAMLKGHIEKKGPGELWNWNCSCGKPVMLCEFWSRVLKDIYNDSFETRIKWSYKSLKILCTSVLQFNAKNTLIQLIHTSKNIEITQQLNEIYTAAANVSNKKFIIDSSKDPMQALAVNECENVDSKFIWLTRDLRAITFSKLKRWQVNKRSDKKPLETLTDSFYYKKICAAAVRCIRKDNLLKMSYESLAANPQQELDRICARFGMNKYMAPQNMELSSGHTIAGTPGRFKSSIIATDNSWKDYYRQHQVLKVLGNLFNSL